MGRTSSFSHPTSISSLKCSRYPTHNFEKHFAHFLMQFKVMCGMPGPKAKSEFNGGSNKNFHQEESLVNYIKLRNEGFEILRLAGRMC